MTLELPVDRIAWDYIIGGYTMNELGKQYDCNRLSIRSRLTSAGIGKLSVRAAGKKTKMKIKYVCKSDFFRVIDSEVSAYWLGFIFADGNISSGSTCLQIQLQRQDLCHIQQFRRDIESNHRIHDVPQNAASKIAIYDRELASHLISWGVIPRKSLVVEYPCIPEEYQRHFIRGVFDGDGCWAKASKYGLRFILASGSEVFLNSVVSVLLQHGIECHVSVHSNRCPRLVISKRKDVLGLFQFLYMGATRYLQRKLHHPIQQLGKEWVETVLREGWAHSDRDADRSQKLATEKWLSIDGFDGYEVSNCGRVRSFWQKETEWELSTEPQRILSPSTYPIGGMGVSLCRDNRVYRKRIANLVTSAFLGDQPEGCLVCHKDNDKENDFVENLYYAPKNYLGKNRQGKKSITDNDVREIRRLASEGESLTKIAKEKDCSISYVSQLVRGIARKAAGGPVSEPRHRFFTQTIQFDTIQES